jgi:hypothetical protein
MSHVSTKQVTMEWHFSVPPTEYRSSKLQLLTIGGIAVQGTWCGQLGQNYVAWAPLLTYDHNKFNETIEAYKNGTYKDPLSP